MYRCSVCRDVVAPRTPMRRHIQYRSVRDGEVRRLEIAREIPVCPECADDLGSGVTLKSLLQELRDTRQIGEVRPAPVPPAPVGAIRVAMPVQSQPVKLFGISLPQRGDASLPLGEE